MNSGEFVQKISNLEVPPGQKLISYNVLALFTSISVRVFSGGDWGVPQPAKILSTPPSDTCPHFWTKACPPPAEVCPRKFEKFEYIFVSNLTTFKLKSTLKSCILCLK